MSSSTLFGISNKKAAKDNYTKVGRKNKTSYSKFIKVCKLGQKELKDHLRSWLKKNYDTVISGDGFLYAKGDIPILVTAHMDTVHKQNVKDFYEFVDKNNGNRHIISSPQGIGGDDRCGVYMIKEIVSSGLKPYVLFCEDEEIGGVGSDKFCETEYIKELENMYFLIELDRAHANDLVYYSDDNHDFHAFCEEATGYEKDFGSFSDISNLSPACGVSSVNISCGYYNAHTTDEYVVMEEMENSIKETISLINAGVAEGKQYAYVVSRRSSLYDWYDYSYYDRRKYAFDDYTPALSKTSETVSAIEKESKKENTYVFYDYDGNEYVYSGRSVEEAIGFMLTDYSIMSWSDISDYWEVDEDIKYDAGRSSEDDEDEDEIEMETAEEDEEEELDIEEEPVFHLESAELADDTEDEEDWADEYIRSLLEGFCTA